VLLTLASGLGISIGPANDIFGWLKVIAAIVMAIVLIYLFVGRRVRRMLVAQEATEEAVMRREADSQAAE